MEAKDLMIGDWVLISVWGCKPFPSKVTSINYNSYQGKDFADWIDTEDEEEIGMYNVQPIPLTPDILEKNFEQMSIEDISVGYQDKDLYTYDKLYRIKESDHYQFSQLEELLSCDGVMLRYEEGRFFIDVEASDCDFGAYGATFKEIYYVHELQHALKLCGIDKEIVL